MREYWQWFLDLNSTRPSGMGMSSIQYMEIYSYFLLNGINAEPQEIQIIKMLDNVATTATSKEQEKNKKNSK